MPNPQFNARDRVIGGAAKPSTGFGGIGDFLQKTFSPDKPTALAKPSRAGRQLVPMGDTLVPKMDVGGPMDLTDDGGVTEASTTDVASKSKGLTEGQATAIGAAGSVMSAVGSVMNTRAQEGAAMEQIAAQTGLSMDAIRHNSALRTVAQTTADVREVLQVANLMKRKGMTGGVQRQQFIENPYTRGFV